MGNPCPLSNIGHRHLVIIVLGEHLHRDRDQPPFGLRLLSRALTELDIGRLGHHITSVSSPVRVSVFILAVTSAAWPIIAVASSSQTNLILPGSPVHDGRRSSTSPTGFRASRRPNRYPSNGIRLAVIAESLRSITA